MGIDPPMPDPTSSPSRRRWPLRLQRWPRVVHLFCVVALTAFLVGLALTAWNSSSFTAEVTVLLDADVVAALDDRPLDGFRQVEGAPSRLVPSAAVWQHAWLEAGETPPLPRDALASGSEEQDPLGDRVRIELLAAEGGRPARARVEVTDPSRRRAEALAAALGRSLAERYLHAAQQVAAVEYRAACDEAQDARLQLAAAQAALDSLLEVHLDVWRSAAAVEELQAQHELSEPAVVSKLDEAERDELNLQLLSLKRKRLQLLEQLTPQHPKVRVVEEQIASIRGQLANVSPGSLLDDDADDDRPRETSPRDEAPRHSRDLLSRDSEPKIISPHGSIPDPSAPPATRPKRITMPWAVEKETALEDEVDEEAALTLRSPTQAAGSSDRSSASSRMALAPRLEEFQRQYESRKRDLSSAEARWRESVAAERLAWQREQQLRSRQATTGEPRLIAAGLGRQGRSGAAAWGMAALILGAAVALAGGTVSPTFTSFDQIEKTLGVPVVGVISAIDERAAQRRKRGGQRWVRSVSLACELLLVGALVWFAFALLTDLELGARFLDDPFQAFCEALDRTLFRWTR